MDEIKDIDPKNIFSDFEHVGFQATNLGKAVKLIERMRKEKATIFLTFTANMVASGLRGIFADMCRRKLIDVVITTGGSLDHDLIRTEKPYLLGDFDMDDKELHEKGVNRIGNILVPNDRYEFLEKKIQPLFEKLYSKNKIVSPSEIAKAIGESVSDKNSFLYWCAKNNIPVFSPGITDSAIGLQVYFFKQKRKDFGIDVTGDMQQLASLALNAEKTGGMILGGGISKHHAIGVNILRGGMDYAVYVTSSPEWDGSLSGAKTKEAVSWGKIKESASHITVNGDATIVFPLMYSKLKV
ncbi:deoxyhypusine synthase [Candidatus Micrarchaeota archaeon]|nr:deoxyhypusine synthase [Candidatus Micrarchaeota archaeon]